VCGLSIHRQCKQGKVPACGESQLSGRWPQSSNKGKDAEYSDGAEFIIYSQRL